MTHLRFRPDFAVNYTDLGAGHPTVVLLHGFPFTSGLWRPQLTALSRQHRVIAPDFRGFGESSLPDGRYALADLADDIAGLLDALSIGGAVLAGLSMGGYVAFEIFRRHRDVVRALILADTRPDPDTPEGRENRLRTAELAHSDGSAAVAEQLLPKLLSPWTRAQERDVERELRDMMESVAPPALEAALMAMADRADSRPLLHRIDVPTLVIVGADDQLTSPDEVRAWSQRIPGARLRVIDRAGHVSNLEQPAAFNEAVLEFLAGPGREGGG